MMIYAHIMIFVAMMAAPQDRPTGARVVIPFDFESRFDEGRQGRTVGDLVWSRLRREPGVILPEAMGEVRDWCQRRKFQPGPETSLEAMRQAVRDQAGDVGIWGKVERVEGHETDVYDLRIKVVDFSGEAPRVVHDKKARTQTVSEVPHTYIKEAIDALMGRTMAAVAEVSPKRRPAIGPNLVLGDFEKGQGRPDGWDEPTKGVSWVKAEGAAGRLVRFEMNADVAGTTGVLSYSDFFPIEAGATYRFACRWRSSGPAAKVFIKCYEEMDTRYKGKDAGASGPQKREVYRSQQNMEGPKRTWNAHEQEFTPRNARFTPRFARVMLYAYWPAGSVEWDDVIVEKVAPAPSAKAPSR